MLKLENSFKPAHNTASSQITVFELKSVILETK